MTCSARMWAPIASSRSYPPTRTDRETTICPSEMTATSLVPPPTSTTIRPTGSEIGTPAPVAPAADPPRGRHGERLRNELHRPRPRRQRRLLDGAALGRGDARRRAHDEARVRAA